MYSVILADDEPLVLDGLECIIPWEKLGFEIKGKAYDGEELIKLVDKHRPSVVVTDIQMPVYTGLECISMIRNINPKTKILILSGYATFEYAKTALSYGITGYLLKPINSKELTGFLERIKEMIEREEKQSAFRSIALNDMMREYLDGNLPGKNLKDIFDFFEIGQIPSSFVLVAIEPLSVLSDDSDKTRAAASYIENLVDKTDAGIFIPYSNSHIVLLIYNKNYLDDDRKSISGLISEIKNFCFANFSIEIKAFCSNVLSSDKVNENLRDVIKLCIENMQIEFKKHSVTESMIEDISNYVEKNYCTVTRSFVAEYFNINPSYLSQSFQKYKGMSFIDFVTEVRIKNAKRLLQTTDMKIQVIAEEVGYGSSQHFAKIFKKSTGIMPSAFRDNLL
ncbi:response regulator [Treponema parvum]|uniref:response regulator n=1 Tax=Treponema parvum TaxID=138851 RepID=UPI001AEBCF50|nr:response regulator [Treponema parvum]QTQ16059.1 response regulator [Treponema parvum]